MKKKGYGIDRGIDMATLNTLQEAHRRAGEVVDKFKKVNLRKPLE